MKYIIGIDAGGTKTDCLIAGQDGNVVSKYTGEGCNPLKDGFQKSAEKIRNAVIECNKKSNIDLNDVSVLLVGSAGVGRKHHKEQLFDAITKVSGFKNIFVETDARIALEGAFSGKPGCVLIAGTGSIIYGKDKVGKLHRVGGFGSLIGDQGGGYSIGRKGLIAVAKQLDGLEINTKISNLLCEKFNIKNKEDLISKVYGCKISVPETAPLVLEAAQEGDETAIIILNEESEELIEQINAMKKKLNEERLNLAFTGSLIKNENYYSKLLKEKIKKELPFVKVIEAENPPAAGAVLLAQKYLTEVE